MKAHDKSPQMPKPVPRSWKAEYDWAFAHYHELVKMYPNQWIAFGGKRVLAHGKALMPVLTQARRKLHGHKDSHEVPHLFVERGIHVYYVSPHTA